MKNKIGNFLLILSIVGSSVFANSLSLKKAGVSIDYQDENGDEKTISIKRIHNDKWNESRCYLGW